VLLTLLAMQYGIKSRPYLVFLHFGAVSKWTRPDQWQRWLTACVEEKGWHFEKNWQKTAYLAHRLILAVE